MRRARAVAVSAAVAAASAWLAVWWHQRLAHGATAVNEENLVLGLTWMDSGKLLVLPLALFAASLAALWRATTPRGRVLTFAGTSSLAALGAAAVGVALEFWGFDWGSYAESFDAPGRNESTLQPAATLAATVALLPLAYVFARRRTIPTCVAPALPISMAAALFLTPTNVLPAVAWLVLAAGAAFRRRGTVRRVPHR